MSSGPLRLALTFVGFTFRRALGLRFATGRTVILLRIWTELAHQLLNLLSTLLDALHEWLACL